MASKTAGAAEVDAIAEQPKRTPVAAIAIQPPEFIRFRYRVTLVLTGQTAYEGEVAHITDLATLVCLPRDSWEPIDEARYHRDSIRCGRATQFERRA